MTGSLEEINKAYAIAKTAGIRLSKHHNQQYRTNFISVMPNNLYGNNNFDLETSHVMPELIRKFHNWFILEGLLQINKKFGFPIIVFPIHPRTAKMIGIFGFRLLFKVQD